MSTKYYACWYRLDRKDAYLIWYSNDPDGVVIDGAGRVPTFSDLAHLRAHADALGLRVKEEDPILHDLDAVARWLERPQQKGIDCAGCLAAWNLCSDVAVSIGDRMCDRDRERVYIVYDKLFWGTNPPSVTPSGKQYKPIWTDAEVEALAEMLGYGLGLFRRATAVAQTSPE